MAIFELFTSRSAPLPPQKMEAHDSKVIVMIMLSSHTIRCTFPAINMQLLMFYTLKYKRLTWQHQAFCVPKYYEESYNYQWHKMVAVCVWGCGVSGTHSLIYTIRSQIFPLEAEEQKETLMNTTFIT